MLPLKRKSILFGLAGLTLVVCGFLSKVFYRDFINSNDINDFGIAGFCPSFFYVAGFSLLLLIQLYKYPGVTILVVTIASILFELKQFLSLYLIDYGDILASVAGGLAAYIIWKKIESKQLSQ